MKHVVNEFVSAIYIGKPRQFASRFGEKPAKLDSNVYNGGANAEQRPAFMARTWTCYGSERRLVTDSKQLARTPAFVGVLMLLYTLGSGLALSQSAKQIGAAALRTHTVAGIVGTVLCFIGIAIVIRQSDRKD